MANYLSREKQVQAIHLICEGSSIRSASRITGVHQYTISKLLLRVGAHCQSILDQHLINLNIESLEIDEVWAYVFKKEHRLKPGDPAEWGSQFVFTALDASSKLIVGHHVGKRDLVNTHTFMADVARRIDGHVQITTDAFPNYPDAVAEHFGPRASYGQVMKVLVGGTNDDDYRYEPARKMRARRLGLSGKPRLDRISTSMVERSNWTIRTFQRRMTRLSNAFSKRLPHLRASICLFMAWYNFCWVHRSLGMTPGMFAGLTNDVWTVDQLVPPWPVK